MQIAMWMQDARYGLRTLAANPTFAVIALGTLALGIGANALMFSLVSGVLLRPLPYGDPARLVQVHQIAPSFGRVSVSNLEAFRSGSVLMEGLAGYVPGSRIVQGTSEPERLGVVRAERSLFDVLGVEAAFGRTFRADDPAGVFVVSGELARRRFGSGEAAVGRTLTLEGQSAPIVGVMPDDFRFPYDTARLPGTLTSAPVAIWSVLEPPRDARARMDFTVGRLKAGTSRLAAQQEMTAIATRLAALSPETHTGATIELVPIAEAIVGSVRPQLLVLLGAVGLVLLAACANVANLLLARACARTREIAVRTAIGAGRLRLVRQLLTESLILALAGGALGFALVQWGTPLLLAVSASRMPRAADIGVDWRVFAFLLGVSMAAGIVFGLAPALAASRSDVLGALKGATGLGGSSGPLRRFRDGLAVAEVALAFILVIAAGLLVRELLRLRATDTGMVTANVLTLHLAPDVTAQQCFELVPQIEAVPGVRAAAFAQMLPLQTWGWNATFSIAGRPPALPSERPVVELRYVTPRYFDALGIPIRRGRAFTDADTASAPRAIIINDTLARRYFGDRDPIGQATDRGTIVGVAGDVRQAGLDRQTLPDIYYPIAQNMSQLRDLGLSLIVSTRVPPASVVRPLRDVIRRADPNLAIFGVKTMDEIVSDSLSERRLYVWLVGSFALLAVVLACAGLYGVISYSVVSRTREFGIRLALGADRGAVQRLVLRHAAALVALGLAIGLGGVLVTTRFLESLIVGASRLDPWTVAATAGLLAGVSAVASLVPARRATMVDPTIALRHE